MSVDPTDILPQNKMARFYLRFYYQGVEVDWYHFDYEMLDSLLENVFELCGPTYHSQGYFDTYEDGEDLCLAYYLQDRQSPLPKDILEKTIEFGWGKTRKELKLIGDRIPIDGDVKFQITYC